MDVALAVSLFLMGLAGAPHCAAMCGAACGAIAGHAGREAFNGTLLAWHAGRVASYAAAGGLVAATVGGLVALQGAAPVLRPLWTMVHVAAIAFGLWLLWTARAPAWLSSASPALVRLGGSQPVRFVKRLPPSGRAGLAGACWAAVPCGLLQSALLVAGLASGPLAGAAAMAAFASASALGLWLGPQVWARLRGAHADARIAAWSMRGAGVLLAGSSLFALWHGLGDAIQALCLPA
jgi:hypothetical protein